MTITLNHTIVHSRNPHATARFVAGMLGLDTPRQLGPFTVLQVGPTSLDYVHSELEIASRHFAFLVEEAEFDLILKKIRSRGIPYWADPFRREQGQINHWDNGRGVYFEDPDGHLLEALTQSYGSNGCSATHPHPLLNCP